MIRPKGSKLVPLTRELAYEVASMDRWSGERDKKKSRVAELLEKIETGLFHSPEWAIAYMNGKPYRMNGQHSSSALVESNGSFPVGMMVKIDEFDVECENDLGLLFAQFDTGGRTSKDITTAGTIALNDIPSYLRTKIVSGMYHAINEYRETRASAEIRVKAIHSDHDFARWAASTLVAKHLSRVPVFAAAFMMWRADKDMCKEFWRLVASEEHPQVNHPTRTAARELRGEANRSNGGLAASREMSARCIHAWNAWVEGREIRYTRYYGALPPISGK